MNGLLESFYRGTRVFVTGHTGFKGGWLATCLKMLGAHVSGFALEPVAGTSFYEAAGVSSGLTSTFGDICEFSALRKAVEDAQPAVVFHLAAQPLVRRSYQDPVGTYAVNVMGTVHLLEVARQVKSVTAVVIVTSDKCYENREWLWGYRENEPMGGFDPYSSSKGCAELITAAYRRSFFDAGRGPGLASCRAGNVIGGGDWSEDRLIPDIARAVLGGKPVVIRNPHSLRPWQHVLEPISGYLNVARCLAGGEPQWADAWNFGPGPDADITVAELARQMLHHWGRGEMRIQEDPNAPHEAVLLRLDSSKAKSLLNWKPVLNAQEAIKLTVDWYRAWGENRSSVRDLTEKQIMDYFRAVV